MEYSCERVEAARRRGLTTNSERVVDTRPSMSFRSRPDRDVAALSLLVVRSAGAFPERVHKRSRNERVFGRGARNVSA